MQIFPNCKYFISVYLLSVCGVSSGPYLPLTGLAARAKGRERGTIQRALMSRLSNWIKWNLGVFTCFSLWTTAELPQRVEFVDYKKYRVSLHDYKNYVTRSHFHWPSSWIFALCYRHCWVASSLVPGQSMKHRISVKINIFTSVYARVKQNVSKGTIYVKRKQEEEGHVCGLKPL